MKPIENSDLSKIEEFALTSIVEDIEWKKYSTIRMLSSSYIESEISEIDDHSVKVTFKWGVDSEGWNDSDCMTISRKDLSLPVEDFKKEWGQGHGEICTELGYDEVDSDELLMEDYFWDDNEMKWYPKSSTFYSKEEQIIANFLRL